MRQLEAVQVVVSVVQPRGRDAHGAVQHDGQVGDGPRLLEAVERVQQPLRAPHGEGRDDDHAAACGRAPHDVAQLLGGVEFDVLAVAISGLDHHPVGHLPRGRRQHDLVVFTAQVA